MPPKSLIPLLLITVFILLIIIGCNRQESINISDNTNYVLKDEDFFIKGLYYQADSATVVKVIGIPDSIKSTRPTARYTNGLSVWKYSDFWIYFGPMKTLFGIWVFHAGFFTAKGLSVGDSLNRVWELYGHSERDSGLPYQYIPYCTNWNDTTSINISIENNLVKGIYVGRMFQQ
jgi:hypothetical protein